MNTSAHRVWAGGRRRPALDLAGDFGLRELVVDAGFDGWGQRRPIVRRQRRLERCGRKLGRELRSFAESTTLCAISAAAGGAKPAVIQVFYGDEHALTLGCATSTYPVSALPVRGRRGLAVPAGDALHAGLLSAPLRLRYAADARRVAALHAALSAAIPSRCMPVSAATAVRFFRRRFRAIGSPERAKAERSYMKSKLRFHGVSMPQLRAAVADFCKEHCDLSRVEVVAIVDTLYGTDWFDLRSAGVVLLDRKRALLEKRDLPWLIGLVRKSGNWAHVDHLATKIVGDVVARDRKLLRALPRWAKDDDFWVRRTSLLAQLGALSHCAGDFALFARLAAGMLHEREFFIRKAIGWVLREVSKRRPELVVAFMHDHGERASGVTVREATKYLPS